jgi:hypothetical protein
MKIVEEHNSDPSQTYKMGINQFSALTDSEFRETYLKNIERRHVDQDVKVESFEGSSASNGEIDWTELGQVSPVKNQGS